MKYLKMFAVGVVAVVLLVLLFSADAPAWSAAFLFLATAAVECLIWEKEMVKMPVTYDHNLKRLYLDSRCAASEKMIKIKEYKHINFRYNPAELVYTGATVGGITTGGFHVNEASYSAASSEKTGRYELHYKGRGYCPINEIFCEFDIDENSCVGNFKTKDNMLSLVHTDSNVEIDAAQKRLLLQATKNNDLTLMAGLTKDTIAAQKLTKEECENIKAWIGGRM